MQNDFTSNKKTSFLQDLEILLQPKSFAFGLWHSPKKIEIIVLKMFIQRFVFLLMGILIFFNSYCHETIWESKFYGIHLERTILFRACPSLRSGRAEPPFPPIRAESPFPPIRAEPPFPPIRRDIGRFLSNPLLGVTPPKGSAVFAPPYIGGVSEGRGGFAPPYIGGVSEGRGGFAALSIPHAPQSIVNITNSTLFNQQLNCNDTTKKDTSKVKETKPQRAALLSTCLPGLGQLYNKKYWKIPIVYGVLGTIGYFAWNNHQNYLIFRNALRARYDDNPQTVDEFPNVNDQVLKAQREYYRRNRDLFIIFGVIGYSLNILDAYVDAHLKGFTVSDQLTIHPIPNFQGIQLGLRWKIE